MPCEKQACDLEIRYVSATWNWSGCGKRSASTEY
jgi:hypothetical protein